MYKIYCDGVLLCDSAVKDSAVISPQVELEENTPGTFTFTLPPGHAFHEKLEQRKSHIMVYRSTDTQPLFAGVPISIKQDFWKQETITCEGDLTFFNDSIQRPARYQGETVTSLLTKYLAAHNAMVDDFKQISLGRVTVTDPNDYIYCYTNMNSTMTELKEDLVDDYGGIMRIRYSGGSKLLDYLAEAPRTNTQVIRIGRNLLDLTRNWDASNIATAVIPLGATQETAEVEGLETKLTIKSVNDGKDYLYSEDAVAVYGWIWATVEYSDVKTAAALKTKGEDYLSSVQWENLVIEATAVDMSLTEEQTEQFCLSDNVRIVSAPHGMDRYFRLQKMSIPLNEPQNTKFTFGKEERTSLTAKTISADRASKKTSSTAEEALIAVAGKVDSTTTVNGKALSSDITLDASDVRAIPTSYIGAAGGVCPLGDDAKVPDDNLPLVIDHGEYTSSVSTAGGNTQDFFITYNKVFTETPHVIVGFRSDSGAATFGMCAVSVMDESTTGFTIRFFNGDSSNRNPAFEWIAIGV